MTSNLALLTGFFIVPLALLALGHRLRERSTRQRGAFWGGVIGHSLALLAAIAALHYPAVLWTGQARTFVAFWLMLVGGVAGALVGAALGYRRRAS
jgi:hypothetical protein